MIKIKAFLLSLVFVAITLFCLNKFFIQKIDNFYKVEDNSVRYNTSAEKYKSFDILKDNILNNTLVVLGSSDLTLTVNESFHPNKTFNYKDFSLMQIGTGYYQNIIHAARGSKNLQSQALCQQCPGNLEVRPGRGEAGDRDFYASFILSRQKQLLWLKGVPCPYLRA